MDRFDPEQNADVSQVVELLTRARPVLTFDEFERLDRRLNTFHARSPKPRRRTRVSVVLCLAFGLFLMTAGTGLAISGFATPGAADHAQYPDRTRDRPPASAGGAGATRQRAQGRPRPPGRHSRPSSLGNVRSAGRASSVYLSLSHAETHSNLPFTGFGAIPVLVAGLLFMTRGAMIAGRDRGA
jgi:hypothetical protein